MQLTQEEFDREKRYLGLMHFVKQMLRDGLITEDEYRQISTDYARQLSPKTGALLVRIDLICEPKRVMNSTGKEGKSLENPTN